MDLFKKTGTALIFALMISGCHAKQAPTQVVYRFDDHRYLELKGWNCEGELWYRDTNKNIRSQLFFQFYRIFTHKFIHPAERYISIPVWGSDAFTVSKDYGKTWQVAQFSPGENEPNGNSSPPYDDILSFTVVNDQGFLQTKHRLYMSSKPFEDPRVLPDGTGINYQLEDGTVQSLMPSAPGWPWGMVYMTRQALKHSTQQYKTNWQDFPDTTPEVKNYKGWDHMRCDMNAGR